MATTINVNFSDSTSTVVTGYFGWPQNTAVWPNQGTTTTDSAIWATYYNSMPPGMQVGIPSPTQG